MAKKERVSELDPPNFSSPSRISKEIKEGKGKLDRASAIRHSLAHLLAAAVLKKFPKAKLGIGPVIENGFYYDFLLPRSLTPDDLKEFEKSIREMIRTNLPFSGKKVTPAEAKKIFKEQQFKLDLIKEFTKEKKGLTTYKTGEIFLDLCRGGHVKNTKEINPDGFKLDRIAGAYWRGDEKNPQLQRIYGLAFETKKELEEYVALIEEAKKRDHRRLGQELELFMFHETSLGAPYWLPKGMIIINELINFWREEHKNRGYQEISSPLINKKELWETSGHWDHYKDDMFIANMGEGEIYGIKPMNCPNAMIVFGSKSRSYRDLPLRLSDTDILHRYERSGVLNGLLRARSFRQDDSHNYVTEDQIGAEYGEIFNIADKFYGIFGLEFRYRLGTRPEGFLGKRATWDKAEKTLKAILDKRVGKGGYEIAEGDGAFYGPKVDIVMKDALKRDWQMGTIQLDFQQPARFGLSYIDENGKKQTPIAVHRVIYGSIERFLAILIENFAGAFPLWLSPVQVMILPVSEKFTDYGKKVFDELNKAGIRVEISDANETLGKRIREAEMQKIPYVLVVGEKEETAKTVNVRKRGRKDNAEVKTSELISKIEEEIESKAL